MAAGLAVVGPVIRSRLLVGFGAALPHEPAHGELDDSHADHASANEPSAVERPPLCLLRPPELSASLGVNNPTSSSASGGAGRLALQVKGIVVHKQMKSVRAGTLRTRRGQT